MLKNIKSIRKKIIIEFVDKTKINNFVDLFINENMQMLNFQKAKS